MKFAEVVSPEACAPTVLASFLESPPAEQGSYTLAFPSGGAYFGDAPPSCWIDNPTLLAAGKC